MEDFEGSDDDNSDSDDSSNSDEDSNIEKSYKNLNNEVTVGNLASISLGQDEIESDEENDNEKIKIEKLTKNIDHLTKKQRLDMVRINISPVLYMYYILVYCIIYTYILIYFFSNILFFLKLFL